MRRIILLAILTGFTGMWMSGQSIYTEFGKNRIQYHDDFKNWWMYETENFVTYWYGKGRNVAHTVVQLAELDNDMIQSILEHRINDKIQIIVYTDLSDLHQSNLGSDEVFTGVTGRTKILGNKLFVYFDGDHQNLRQKIREGVAGVYLESMLHGSNLQEMVQNAVLLNLPEWFREGLIGYLSNEWGSEQDNALRDLFQNPTMKERFLRFDYLARDYPRIAGHAFWFYLSNRYGKSAISNILYLTRINRDLENAFLYVLGLEYEDIVQDWYRYFQEKFDEEHAQLNTFPTEREIPLGSRKSIPVTHLKLSPDGQTLAYVRNEQGKTKLFLMDVRTGKKKRIFKNGIRNNLQEIDDNYPAFAWHPENQKIALVYEKRDILYLKETDLRNGKERIQTITPEFHRIYSVDYWTPDTLVFSATIDGLSDLFFYTPVSRQFTRINQDFYDDLEASVVSLQGRKGILFRSNRHALTLSRQRLDTILPIENFDLFFLAIQGDKKTLHNLTNSPHANERDPALIGDDRMVYLSNESGIWNRKLVENPMDTGSVHQFVSNYHRNILLQTSTPGSDILVEYARISERDKLFSVPLTSFSPTKPVNVEKGLDTEEGEGRIVPFIEEEEEILLEDDPRYRFQMAFPVPPKTPEKQRRDTITPQKALPEPLAQLFDLKPQSKRITYDQSKVIPFRSAQAIAHRLRFRVDYVNTTMDNSLLFNTLDSYAGLREDFQQPPLGILLKANIKDLFEDYVLEGGARFPTSFNGSEYFLIFQDRKKRIDKQYAIYRKTTQENRDNGRLRSDRFQTTTVIGQVQFKYPLDIYTSIRATGTIRNDRFNQLITDFNNLNTGVRDDQRIGLKVEYVYDNTLQVDINFRHGTRYKAWVEVVKKFDLNLFEEGQGFTFNDGFMTVIGVDARHYQRLDRHSILAARFTASTSFGSERVLFYMGGVENAMFSNYDNSIPVPGDRNFAFQTIAAQMRGFDLNARNGASVALVNAELRVPFIRYLSRRKIKSSFLRNLQVVGFLDIGTAWHGTDPFSRENPLNTLVLTNPPTVEVEVKYFRNPIIMGYGAGLRTLLFGYFLKLDYAWGKETRRTREPMLHFSIGTDF